MHRAKPQSFEKLILLFALWLTIPGALEIIAQDVTNNDKMIALAHKAVEDNGLKGAFIRAPARPGNSGRTQGPWYGLGGLANRINKPGFSIMGSMGAYWQTGFRGEDEGVGD